MKSGGFHVKSKDHLQGIVTLCFQNIDVVDFLTSIMKTPVN